jgi:hypothetical protein
VATAVEARRACNRVNVAMSSSKNRNGGNPCDPWGSQQAGVKKPNARAF